MIHATCIALNPVGAGNTSDVVFWWRLVGLCNV